MDQNTSRAIDITRALAIMMVVILHARTGVNFTSATSASMADVMSRGLGALGVPLFLLISGFLSSTRAKDDSAVRSLRRIAKRTSDLAIIYILWNILVVIAAISMIYFGIAPGDFMSTRLNNGISGVFGLDSEFPIAYQFWFIRELILISLVVGCIGNFIKNKNLAIMLFAAIALLMILFFDYRTSVSFISYCLGYLIGREQHERGWPAYSPGLLRKIFVASVVISMALLIRCEQTNNWAGFYITIFLATGSTSVLSGSLIITIINKNFPAHLFANASFFIFAAHEPFLTVLKKIIGAKLPAEVVYIASPAVVVVFLFAVYSLVPAQVKDVFWFIFRGSRPKRRIEDPRFPKPLFK